MNYSNITSRITYSNNNFQSAYNTNDYVFNTDQRYRTTPETYKIDNSILAMKNITTKGVPGDVNPETEDELSKMFYSQENMRRIQKKIRETVFERTKGQFRLDVDQDDQDLLITMRAVFLEHARFLPFRIIHQVKDLNRRVIEYIVPEMITQIKQYYGYIKEISEPIKPIPRPINVNNAGRKTLPALTTSFGF